MKLLFVLMLKILIDGLFWAQISEMGTCLATQSRWDLGIGSRGFTSERFSIIFVYCKKKCRTTIRITTW